MQENQHKAYDDLRGIIPESINMTVLLWIGCYRKIFLHGRDFSKVYEAERRRRLAQLNGNAWRISVMDGSVRK